MAKHLSHQISKTFHTCKLLSFAISTFFIVKWNLKNKQFWYCALSSWRAGRLMEWLTGGHWMSNKTYAHFFSKLWIICRNSNALGLSFKVQIVSCLWENELIHPRHDSVCVNAKAIFTFKNIKAVWSDSVRFISFRNNFIKFQTFLHDFSRNKIWGLYILWSHNKLAKFYAMNIKQLLLRHYFTLSIILIFCLSVPL